MDLNKLSRRDFLKLSGDKGGRHLLTPGTGPPAFQGIRGDNVQIFFEICRRDQISVMLQDFRVLVDHDHRPRHHTSQNQNQDECSHDLKIFLNSFRVILTELPTTSVGS